MRGTPLRVGLAAVALVLTFGVAELVLRVAGYDPLGELSDGRELVIRPSANADLKYELAPGTSGVVWGHHVEINEDGYRGPRASPGGFDGYRVVAIGDSLTFGNSLPFDVVYPTRFQSHMDAGLEVVNLGVGGYDVLQAVAMLEERGLAFEPDLVVLGFCLNDVGVESLNLRYIERLEQYRDNPLLELRVAQWIASLIDRIRVRSFMAEKNEPEVFARDHEGRIAEIPDDDLVLRALMKAAPDRYPSSWYRSEPHIGRLRYAFEKLAALSEREGFRAVVLIFPMLMLESGHYPHKAAHGIVQLEARRAGLPTLDLAEAYIQRGLVPLRLRAWDPIHPDAIGHEIAAQLLATYVREQLGAP